MRTSIKAFFAAFLLVQGCSGTDATPSSPGACAATGCQEGGSDAAGLPDGPAPFDYTPPPSNVLISDPSGDSVSGLRLSGGYFYWFGGLLRIVRAPVSGGAPTTLFTHAQQSSDVIEMSGLVVDETGVYFSDGGDTGTRGIYKMPLDGGSAPVRIAEGNAPHAMAAEGDDICFEDAGDIRHITRSGGPGNTLVRGVGGYRTQLAVSGGYCYFQAAIDDMAENLWRMPLTAVAPDPDAGADAASGQPEKVSIVPGRYLILLAPLADHGFVYWSAGDSVFRASATMAATEVAYVVNPLDPINQGSPSNVLFAHANVIYWETSFGSSSTLYRRAVDNGTTERVQDQGKNVRSLVADDQFLYGAAGPDIVKLAL